MSVRKKLDKLGSVVADKVSRFVGTWTFVFLYTMSMVIWIVLHITGVLDIDSEDFIKWNLWLSYFAGTQASLVLMSSSRQAERDRNNHNEAWNIDKQVLDTSTEIRDRIAHLTHQMSVIEDVLDDLTDPECTDEKPSE